MAAHARQLSQTLTLEREDSEADGGGVGPRWLGNRVLIVRTTISESDKGREIN